MVSTLAAFAFIPVYKQIGVGIPNFDYILMALITTIVVYFFDLFLDIIQRKGYFELEPPSDVISIIREIDEKSKGKVVETTETEPKEQQTLETRVRNNFSKSQLYGQDCSLFHLFKSGFINIVDITLTLTGFLPYLYDISKSLVVVFIFLCINSEKLGFSAENEIACSLGFILINTIFDDVLRIPWDLYRTFVIEEKHGFNKQGLPLFIKDLVKSFFVNQLISLPIYSIVIIILRKAGEHAYIYVWISIVLFSIVANMLYPIVIMPLFNTMKPMDPSPLRDRIYDLAGKVGFRVGRIQVIDSSQRTGHSNAAAYGFFGVNGILIYDNLLEQLSDDEIISVIAHELGHWKHGHTYRMMFTNAIYMYVLMYTFSMFVFNKNIYYSFGFADSPVIVGLILFLSCVWEQLDEILSVFMNILSRKYEYQADEFAVKYGYGHALQVSLTKLNVENSSSLIDNWLVSLIRHSHPSLVERCQKINSLSKKME